MPIVQDATVINQAYSTEGNGGRKLVRLSNGWLVAVNRNTTTNVLYLQVDKMDSNGFVPLCSIANKQAGFSLVAKGTFVYVLCTNSPNDNVSSFTIDVLTQANIDIANNSTIRRVVDSGQSTIGESSLAINDAGTELHAAWSSKNATYPNSFNIRYAKGTINGDGSVTWGAVVQISTLNNTTGNNTSPSVSFNANGLPILVWSLTDTAGSDAIYLSRFNGTSWSGGSHAAGGHVFRLDGWTQSSPSAIFVPSAINGLANGRIWVVWHGTDSTYPSYNSIRCAYSDDGGVTWSAMQRLTSDSSNSWNFPSITANKNNDIFIITSGSSSLAKLKLPNGGTWEAIETVKTIGNNTYPSTLFDLSMNFTLPLFIYKDTSKIGFYGTWTATTISVTQGDIGTKSDKTNLLTYAITTDGTMGTITESVNGTTIAAKNIASGVQTVCGLTQAQWDAIKFGKYKDATGGLNTLTISMDGETFTYTFDKRLATGADVLSAVKAVQDSQNVYLPAVKAKMAAAITAKGGTAASTDSWETMISAVANDTKKRWASGTAYVTANTYLTVNNLTFAPRYIVMWATSGSIGYRRSLIKGATTPQDSLNGVEVRMESGGASVSNVFESSFTATGFTAYCQTGGSTYTWNWIAFE